MPSTSVKLLGIHIEKNLSFDARVKSVVKSCNFNKQSFCNKRCDLPVDIIATAGLAIMMATDNYYNSAYYNLCNTSLASLSCIQ